MARYVSVPFLLSAHSLLTDFTATALNQCLLVALKYFKFKLISAYIWAFALFFLSTKKEKHSYHYWRQSSAFGGLECVWLRPRPLYFKKEKKKKTFFCLLWFLITFCCFHSVSNDFFWDFTLGGELWAKCQATTARSRTLFKQWIQRI